jgi:excisionase family DNA binding protein
MRKKRMPGNLLNVNEAAQLLALKPATLRAWILRRKIEFVRVGRAVRIPKKAIEELIQENTVPVREQYQ